MINPVLASSAMRRMRSPRTPIIVTIYCAALTAFVYFYSFQDFSNPSITISQMGKGIESYLLLIGLQFAMLVLVAPAMTAGSIAGERERQTLDLLQVTNTSSFSIVMGKLLESFGFLCLLILSSMPVLSLVMITGGISLLQMLMAVLYLLLTALAALSVGLFASALLKKTVTATVVSYLSIFGLGVVTILPLWWDVQNIGATYDAARLADQVLQSIDYMPVSFTISPVLGLFSLLSSHMQTGITWFVIEFSHTLRMTFQLLPFDRYLTYHMAFLAGFSLVLISLSTWFIRPNRRMRRRVK